MTTRKGFFLTVGAFGAVVSAGVPQTDVYPAIEYWTAGDYSPNPLCEKASTPKGFSARFYGTRTAAGLWGFAKGIYQIFSDQMAKFTVSDLSYNLKQENLDTSYDGVKKCAILRPALAIQRNKAVSKYPILPDNPTRHYSSVSDGVCGCLDTTGAEAFCMNMGNYSAETQCLTQYEYEDYNAVLQELDPNNDFGWKFYDSCTGSISAGVEPLQLPLNNFLENTGVPGYLESSQIKGEGKTYYMLYKAIDHLDRYAEYQYLQTRYNGRNSLNDKKKATSGGRTVTIDDINTDSEIFEEILPGWRMLRIFNGNDPAFNNGPSARFPLMAMAANDQGNLLFVVRSPITTFDERLALYNQQAWKYLYNFTGQVHDGSANLFQAISGAVDFAVDDFYNNKVDKSSLLHPKITVTGANLPSSGLAVLLGDHLVKQFQPVFSPTILEVDVVAFGDSKMADAAYVNDMKTRVNIRNVVLEGDGRAFPCATTVSCNEDVLPPRTGVNTGDLYSYALLPGRAQIPLSSMIQINDYWAQPDTIFDLAAIRHCGYKCYLGSNFCKDDEDNRCFEDTCGLMITTDSKNRY